MGGSKNTMGIATRLTAAFVGLAALAALAGGASSWFALQSAGIVTTLGSRSLPTVTAALGFAQQSAVLAAEAPGLASQSDAEGLAAKAARVDVILADQQHRIAELHRMGASSSVLNAAERSDTELAAKIAELRAAAADQIALRGKVQTCVADALSAYQTLMDVVRPLEEATQAAVDSEKSSAFGAQGGENSPALKTLDADMKTLAAAMDVQASGNLAFGMLSAVANASEESISDIRSQYNWAEVYLGKSIKAFQPQDAERIAPLIKALLDIGAGPEGMFALRDRQIAESAKIAKMLSDLAAITATLGEDVASLVATEEADAKAAVDRSTAVTHRTIAVNAATSGVVIVAALLLGFVYVRRSVTRRLTALAGTMGRLAAGDLETTVNANGRDEIADMARSVQVFQTTMIHKKKLDEDAVLYAKDRDAARAAQELERSQASARQAVVMQGLAAGLTRLAQGDLSHELTEPFAAEYDGLRCDFNAAVEQLRAAMAQVVDKTAMLGSGTTEIAGAADDLSRRTENQSASLEETAAALGEVTQGLRNTADGAAHARDAVGLAMSQAEQSGRVMRDAVAAMGAIEASSGRIGQIIGVVDEIAFQTNLLALNAGVEAARAGEAGRGFAVVASEVRALAQRSAEAAKEIKALVSSSTTEVGRGVALVGQGGEALDRMLGEVGAINTIVTEIARAAHEQMVGLEQVNTAMGQMDQVTQQNAAMVEETTAATHNLAREIQGLVDLMGRFKVGAPPQAHQRGASASAQSARAPAPKTRGRGALAQQISPVSTVQESWDEF